MSTEPARLQLVRGTASAEELAAVAALLAAPPSADTPPAPTPRSGQWNKPTPGHRTRPWQPGPGAWRASARH